MGNSSSGRSKSGLANQNTAYLHSFLTQLSQDPNALIKPLNPRGDVALILAIRYGHYDLVEPLIAAGSMVETPNNDNETAIDILAMKIHSSSLRSQSLDNACHISEDLVTALQCLLVAGAEGEALQTLALHIETLPLLCEWIPNSTLFANYQLCSLLLKMSAWYNLTDTLKDLLKRGLDLCLFWDVPFVRPLVPNMRYQELPWPEEENKEYSLPAVVADSTLLEAQKVGLLSDWRIEWEGGENLHAQFRAGLQLPPQSALIFIQAANEASILAKTMKEVISYLPPNCGGPLLSEYHLTKSFFAAGHNFTQAEINKLKLTHGLNIAELTLSYEKPAPLKHLSRLCVRSSLVTNVMHGVECLVNLPYPLKCYLLLADVVS